ncbi:MAG TPA: fibronectin type III domain-containing protein, partial [Acidobacteriota bacterium]|nr:fibronectin type III domain-containing protein [Acidobacteriota bacterium]
MKPKSGMGFAYVLLPALLLLVLIPGRVVFAADVTLAWDANSETDLAGYKVYYGASSRNYSTVINVGKVTTYTLTGLAPGTYYFAVTAFNTAQAESAFSNEVSKAIGDTTPPVISSVTATGITASTAVVGWTTNEASDSQVEYGPTTSYGTLTTLNSTLVTSHSQSLSGLLPGALYNFRVRSRDSAGNLALSGNYTFTTAVPCTYSLSSNGQSVGAGSSTGSVGVSTNAGCGWSASSNAPWIAITSGGTGSGSGTVNFAVAVNTTSGPRTGTMTIAGQTFTISQAKT